MEATESLSLFVVLFNVCMRVVLEYETIFKFSKFKCDLFAHYFDVHNRNQFKMIENDNECVMR